MDCDPLDCILRPGPKGEWKGRWIEMKVAAVAPQLASDSWWKHIGTDWNALEKAQREVPWKLERQKQAENQVGKKLASLKTTLVRNYAWPTERTNESVSHMGEV